MKNTSIVWRLVAAIGIAVFFAACSDGELQLGDNLDIAPPAPVILKFVADPAQVEVGGTTTLYWEVEVADSIEIAAAPESIFQFHAGPLEELSGSTQVTEITETTEFILTASKTVMAVVPASGDESAATDENPATAAIAIEKAGQIPLPGEPPVPSTSPVTSSAQKSVTVTVVGPQAECSVDITSDSGSAPINAGDSTTIRWTATPDTVQVNVNGSDGTSVAVNSAASGNATITPDETTTYTATAVCPDGQQKGDSVTVTVSESNVEPNIKANGEEDLVTVANYTNGVNITYDVTPASALVKVEADGEVDCTPALPAEFVALTDGTGTPSICILTGDTTFTITAKIGERQETDKVKVVLQGGQMADALVTAAPWAFEGETVKITADPDAIEGNNRALIKEIKVAGKVYPLPATGPLVVGEVLVPSGGIDVTVVSVSDVEIQHPKVVQAVTPITMIPTDNIEEFSRIVLDAANPEVAYIGVKKPGYCQNGTCGHVSAYKSNLKNVGEYAHLDVNIGTELLNTAESSDFWSGGDGSPFFGMVKDYPVSSIAIDESRIFVGSTGALVYSDDSGASWKKIMTFLRFYADDHKTCAGETQPGNGQGLGSLGRACDLIAQNNHLIVATDRGVLTVKDMNSFASSADNSLIVGRPPAGPIPSEPQYLTYGAVANDLEATDDAVFAATEKGLFKTSDNGETWEKIDGIDDELFSVAVDKKDSKIYVGTGTGIKFSSLTDSGTWQSKELAQKVYSLAVDPYQAGVVLAGTSSGLYVTRDNGESWTAVGAGGFEGKAVKSVVIAAQVDEANDQVQYSISFGGVGGAVADSITVRIVAPAPVPQDDGGDETGDETGDTTGGTDDGTTGDVTDDTTTGGGTEPSLAIRAYNYVVANFIPLISD